MDEIMTEKKKEWMDEIMTEKERMNGWNIDWKRRWMGWNNDRKRKDEWMK